MGRYTDPRGFNDLTVLGPIHVLKLRFVEDNWLFGERIQPGGSAHVAYWTSAGERGHGHATRGLILLLRYARSIGFDEVEAHIV